MHGGLPACSLAQFSYLSYTVQALVSKDGISTVGLFLFPGLTINKMHPPPKNATGQSDGASYPTEVPSFLVFQVNNRLS